MKSFLSIAALLAATLLVSPACRRDRSPRITTLFTAKNVPTSGSENFQEVNVDIQKLQMHVNGGSWVDISTNSGVYNMLAFKDGATLVLTDNADLPKAAIDKVRVIVGDRNSVVYNNTIYPMPGPTGEPPSADVSLNTRFIPRREYELLLSIDVEKSITIHPDGSYSISPVIKLEKFRVR